MPSMVWPAAMVRVNSRLAGGREEVLGLPRVGAGGERLQRGVVAQFRGPDRPWPMVAAPPKTLSTTACRSIEHAMALRKFPSENGRSPP